jgi:hypothetical protein
VENYLLNLTVPCCSNLSKERYWVHSTIPFRSLSFPFILFQNQNQQKFSLCLIHLSVSPSFSVPITPPIWNHNKTPLRPNQRILENLNTGGYLDFHHFLFICGLLKCLCIVFFWFRCDHYRRRCKIRAPCCNQIFPCRHCHNEATVCVCVGCLCVNEVSGCISHLGIY